ncbi:MAG: Bifunctional protein GlmU [Chlamydiia bacterium]|nr:Bifunctional protein GlmU [Chlamydiia bacterium]
MKKAKLQEINRKLFAYEQSFFSFLIDKSPYPWDLHAIFLNWLTNQQNKTFRTYESVHFKNKEEILIEQDVIIEPGALIEGPCFIGRGTKIGHNALIRAYSFLAPHVYVGHCSEVNHSILLEHAKAPHFNYIGHSVVGVNVNFGAHSTVANLRLDQNDIKLWFNEEQILTNKRKMGAFIGDDVSIGCGALLNPGTIIEPKTLILPHSIQKGHVG